MTTEQPIQSSAVSTATAGAAADSGSVRPGDSTSGAPPVATLVHLIRHGEVANPTGVLYGRLPGFTLSTLGVQMADRLASVLGDRDIGLVVSSPLERAVRTATPLARALNVPVLLDDRVIEASNLFEGQRLAPGDGALRDPRNWWLLRDPLTPSWGEPYRTIALRMFSAVTAARRAVPGREAVIVSHQLPIWVARLAAEQRPFAHDPRRRLCALASVTSLMFEQDELVHVEYREPARDLADRAHGGAGA